MTTLSTGDPMAVAVVGAIHTGSLTTLARLLGEHPGLATVRLGGDGPEGMARTLLHVATDWPGTSLRVRRPWRCSLRPGRT